MVPREKKKQCLCKIWEDKHSIMVFSELAYKDNTEKIQYEDPTQAT